MALIKDLQNKLSNIGNAIREMSGRYSLIKIEDMPNEILSLSAEPSELAEKLIKGEEIRDIYPEDLEGFTRIGSYAFAHHKTFWVGVPNSVTEIADYGFKGVEVVTMYCSIPPKLGKEVFDSETPIEIPEEYWETYKADNDWNVYYLRKLRT